MQRFISLLGAWVLIQAVWSRPLMPEPSLGTGSAAFSGGGAAHLSGPNAVFVNPAALSIPDGYQAEAGMMGMTAGISPYFLLGSNAGEHNAYAVGYYYDARVDPDVGGAARQGMIAGGSWDIDRQTAVGVSVHSQGMGAGVGLDGFGVDADLGLLYRPKNMLWTGLTIHNLMKSGIGLEPEGYRTNRTYLAAIGVRMPVFDLLGLRLHDPDAFYELRSEGLPPEKFNHIFSLASSFLPNGQLGLRGSFLIPHGASPGFALGSLLRFPAGNLNLTVGYVFDSGVGVDMFGKRSPSHSLSVNLSVGSEKDEFPPVVEARADKLVLASDTVGEIRVHFSLYASDKTLVSSGVDGGNRSIKGKLLDQVEEGMRGYGRQFEEGSIRDWKLEVKTFSQGGQSGPLMKSFQGKDLPPRIIRWDGRDDAGQVSPPGIYAFRFSAHDLAGNESATVWQLLDLTVPVEPASPALERPAPSEAPGESTLDPSDLEQFR